MNSLKTPVTLAVVGRSGVGKTTLIKALLPLLKSEGFKVATLKHTHHSIDLEKAGSDTEGHKAAGARQVALAGAGFCVLWFEEEREAEEMARLAGMGCDLLLIEGYKSAPLRRMEIVRDEPPMLAEGVAWLTLRSDQVETAFRAIVELLKGE